MEGSEGRGGGKRGARGREVGVKGREAGGERGLGTPLSTPTVTCSVYSSAGDSNHGAPNDHQF